MGGGVSSVTNTIADASESVVTGFQQNSGEWWTPLAPGIVLVVKGLSAPIVNVINDCTVQPRPSTTQILQDIGILITFAAAVVATVASDGVAGDSLIASEAICEAAEDSDLAVIEAAQAAEQGEEEATAAAEAAANPEANTVS